MTCPDCSTQILCKGEIPLCKVTRANQKPATWTDSPPLTSEPAPSKEPVWIVWFVIGAGAIALAAKFFTN